MIQNLLTKHCFKNRCHFFGLDQAQYSEPKLVHNGGWFNKFGENIGWGDLSPEDINRISSEINEYELFIVLYERDSSDSISEDAPGIKYVGEKCFMIISRNKVMVIPSFPGIYSDPYDTRILNCVWGQRKQTEKIIKAFQ